MSEATSLTDRQAHAAGEGEASRIPLRVIVLTAGPLVPVNRVFFERLASDPLLTLLAIVVDEYEKPRKSFPARVYRRLRKGGWRSLWFRVTSIASVWAHRALVRVFDLTHPPAAPQESYEALGALGIRVLRVADINGEESHALLRSLQPQLGVIVGGRILRERVLAIPRYGTINIHKRKVPEYRGGGPLGYWELLAGESSIGVTIHYATREVDAGPVLAEATLPIEEGDNLESLRVKADIVGGDLYHDTIRRIALGHRQGTPQDASRGRTYRAPSDLKVRELERQLEKRAATIMPYRRVRISLLVRARVLIQYALLLPLLLVLRTRLVKARRAPICIFYYHLVSNRGLNHMCLPLEEFVRQVAFLQRYYKVVSLDEAVLRLRSGKNDEIAAVITFDDGYQDNTWAIEYLRYFGIPAAFFISAGHVRDGVLFEHDRRRGFEEAVPMAVPQVRRLASDGFIIGSHALYHEDFSVLDPGTADRVLRESRQLLAESAGRNPEHFSFPWGLTGRQITRHTLELAQRHYRYVYSADGGYNLPCADRQHFLRVANPHDTLSLAMIMDGYTGFRQCLVGNAWGLKKIHEFAS